MRKILIGVLVVLLVLVATVVAAPFLLPDSVIKGQVERIASTALGRSVRLGDDFDLRPWPPLAVHATDVRVANAPGFQPEQMAQAAELDLEIDLFAYLRGVVDVKHLVLRRPELRLVVGPDGRANWRFADGESDGGGRSQGAGPTEIPGFVLGEVRIEDGLITYEDAISGLDRRAENVELTMTQPASGAALAIAGGLLMEGERATLEGTVADPAAVAQGEGSRAELSLTVPGGTARYDGTVAPMRPAANGKLDVEIASPQELAGWLGQDMPVAKDALDRVALATSVDVTADRVTLEPLKITIGSIEGSGNLAASLGDRPALSGKIGFGAVDLDPFLPAQAQPGDGGNGGSGVEATGWSDEPLPVPIPLPIDLDLQIRAESLKASGLQLADVDATITADDQAARVALAQLGLSGGTAQGELRTTAGNVPRFEADLTAQGVQLRPLLQTFAEKDRLAGTGNVELDLTTEGASMRALMGAMNGTGNILVRDGALIGINIGAMVRQIMNPLSAAASGERRTDFAELGGSFAITDGTLRNDDLRMVAPVLRLDGAGTTDLAERTLDYRVTPQLAATLEGQGASGEPELKAGVPFVVTGSWSDPAIRFDLGGALTDAIRNPDDVAAVVQSLAGNPETLQKLRDEFGVNLPAELPTSEEGVRDLLGRALGGGEPAAGPEGGGNDKPKVEDAVRGLLRGLGRN